MKLNKFHLIAGGAVAAGAVLAFALPAGAAVTVQSQSPPAATVKLGSTATLDANGAVVFAPVKVVCRPGQYASLSVTVAENVNGDIASGTTYQEIEQCDGTVQNLQVAVIPTQKAFKKGIAFGQAKLEYSGNNGYHTAVDQHNIQIVERH